MARAHGSYPWCRGFESPSRYYKKGIRRVPFFVIQKCDRNMRHHGVVLRGARGPGDLGFAPTEAERRPNPPLAIAKGYPMWGILFAIQKNDVKQGVEE